MSTRSELDPANWDEFRKDAHRMLDDVIDYLEHIRSRPVWQPIPAEARDRICEPLPRKSTPLSEVHRTFMEAVLPYAVGNAHPGFMGWVHGGGTAVGMLAEMLAAGVNANLGGRNQMPVEVERQVAAWVRDLLGFPAQASGLLVTGTSMATFIALLVAKTAALGPGVRQKGLAGCRLVGYAAHSAHGSIGQAFELCGMGRNALRLIPLNDRLQMDVAALAAAVEEDRRQGKEPFFVVGTAGTVDTGAIDDLRAIADLARKENLWFHVDGAYGALAMFAPGIAPRLTGIERADSVACDFHKWGQVPYDAGLVLIRDGETHRATFAASERYLKREERGLAAGSFWPCDFGPDLSRGFRALKVWFTLKVFGTEALGRAIAKTCDLASYLELRVQAKPQLELLAPVALNIVCFRYRCPEPKRINLEIVTRLQESGIAAPSTTVVGGRLAIRAAIVNHRTDKSDIDALVDAVIALGDELTYQK